MPLERIENIKLLRLRGSAYDMGEEHGHAMRDIIRQAVIHFVHNSEMTYELPPEILIRDARQCLPHIPRAYVEEMEGLAEGSGTSFDEILALNCLPDVDAHHTQRLLQCCNFVLSPPATTNGEFLHGRNLDFPSAKGWITNAAVLIVRHPDDSAAVPTLSVGFAGFVGTFTGYSANQLTAAEVTSPVGKSHLDGMPLPLLLRNALERASSVGEFYSVVRHSRRTCGYNLAVGDGKTRESAAIEITRDFCELRRPKRGVLIVDNVCFCKKTARHRLTYAAGAFRYARMMQLIDSHRGRITGEIALGFLADDFDLARATHCGDNYNCICNHDTVQSVLFLPAEGRVLVSTGFLPAPKGEFTEIGDAQLWNAPPVS